MTDKLPPNLLALFAPRPPLRWMEPVDYAAQQRKTFQIGGLAQFLPALQQYKDNDNYLPTESWLERRDRRKLERKDDLKRLLTEGPSRCPYSHLPKLDTCGLTC
jgi:U1 small nuclear ribonucleoprotein 70kDa